jgi:hypothetical protein
MLLWIYLKPIKINKGSNKVVDSNNSMAVEGVITEIDLRGA